jgi:DNA-binding MarR family transcriptional regulator
MLSMARASQHFERRVPGVAYGVLDELVGYALRRAQIAIYEDFETALGPLEITPQRFAAMVVIAENPGITQGMLGRILGIARSGVVQLIHALQKQGWVVREPHDGDARVWSLALTPAGRRRLSQARRRVRAHDLRVTVALSPLERTLLVGLLDRLGAGRPRIGRISS